MKTLDPRIREDDVGPMSRASVLGTVRTSFRLQAGSYKNNKP